MRRKRLGKGERLAKYRARLKADEELDARLCRIISDVKKTPGFPGSLNELAVVCGLDGEALTRYVTWMLEQFLTGKSVNSVSVLVQLVAMLGYRCAQIQYNTEAGNGKRKDSAVSGPGKSNSLRKA